MFLKDSLVSLFINLRLIKMFFKAIFKQLQKLYYIILIVEFAIYFVKHSLNFYYQKTF